jgi:hypothetical protein
VEVVSKNLLKSIGESETMRGRHFADQLKPFGTGRRLDRGNYPAVLARQERPKGSGGTLGRYGKQGGTTGLHSTFERQAHLKAGFVLANAFLDIVDQPRRQHIDSACGLDPLLGADDLGPTARVA